MFSFNPESNTGTKVYSLRTLPLLQLDYTGCDTKGPPVGG